MKNRYLLGTVLGAAAFLLPIATFASTGWTMSSLSAPSNLVADVIGATGAGVQLDLNGVAMILGDAIVLGACGWILVKLGQLLASAFHLGRR